MQRKVKVAKTNKGYIMKYMLMLDIMEAETDLYRLAGEEMNIGKMCSRLR